MTTQETSAERDRADSLATSKALYATAKKQSHSGGRVKLLGFDIVVNLKRFARVSSFVGGYGLARCEEFANLCVF